MARDVEPINNYGTFGRTGRSEPHDPARRRRRGTGAPAPGRYEALGNARSPAGGLGTAPRKNRAAYDPATAAVADPFDEGGKRLLATVNRRVDLLEDERAHGRVDEAAYLTGRALQALFERASRLGSSNWDQSGRVDQRERQRLAMARLMCNAVDINKAIDRIGRRVGAPNMRILRRILGDRISYEACAGLIGKSGPRGRAFVAQTFRYALEDLAQAQQARGAVPPPPDDAYAAAAPGVPGRQRDALAIGTTLARLIAELAAARASGATKQVIGELEATIAGLRLAQGLARAAQVADDPAERNDHVSTTIDPSGESG